MHKLVMLDNIDRKKRKVKVLKNENDIPGYRKRLDVLFEGKKIYPIGRDSNPDGLFGPALILHRYNMAKNDVFFTQQSRYLELLEELKMRKIRDSVFVASDLSINESNLSDAKKLLNFIKSGNNDIVWLDHHPWDKKSINSLKNMFSFLVYGESDIYCATDLVYLFVAQRDKESKTIKKLAHYSDFPFLGNKYRKILDRLTYPIVYFRYIEIDSSKLRDYIYLISKLKLNDKFIISAYKKYMKIERENKKLLVKNLYKLTSTPSIGIGFTRILQSNSGCYFIMDKLNTDIAIYVNIESGKAGIRSKSGVDGSLIALALGGGGHPQASSFITNASKFKNFDKKSMKDFVEKLERVAEKVYN